jgi:hypothetical protein
VTALAPGSNYYRRMAQLLAMSLFLFVLPSHSVRADSGPQLQLEVSKAGPRAVESMTERSVFRDYRFAWTSLAEALESNSLAPLNGPFVGTARGWLEQAVGTQRQNGLRSRYISQNHKVDAVFYAPEGDVMELHDTAQYQLQLLDGSKIIHDENVVIHYVVLMTPAADRWVVRQLQAVQGF